MQAYLTFFDKINKLLETAGSQAKFQLGLDICKKLYPDYESYCNKRKVGDASALLEAINHCEKVSDQPADQESLTEEWIKKINFLIPDTEGQMNWDVNYAANAVQVVYELLAFLKDSGDKHISSICSFYIDTTDFKIAEANEHLSDDGIFKHPQMLESMNQILEKLKV